MKTALIAVEQPQNELGNDLEGVPFKSVFPRTKAHNGAIKREGVPATIKLALRGLKDIRLLLRP